ncbi:interleukin-7 receptor subunit alpha [Nelusetta ayraudi]|uniref:interleukin-7 receptor subunit alpha n=1 Tax=Nelusetta ayraudi TaxID=303726 RepID=UPI003F6E6764
MPPGCGMTVALALLLLLLPAASLAQSGDGESVNMEQSLHCISHISTKILNLSCELAGSGIDEDDEDAEASRIQKMTACFFNLRKKREECFKNESHSMSMEVIPVFIWNVTVECAGRKITKRIDLKKIVKPRTPEVQNITINQESNQVVIYIGTPYEHEYIKVRNQLFQVSIRSPTDYERQNISSSYKIIMRISMDRLQKGTKYNVAVRAIPYYKLQGTWSEWSEGYSFDTPRGRTRDGTYTWTWQLCILVCLIVLLVVAVVFFWKHKIFTCTCPIIPHPKYTLVHICSPNTGLLMNVKPEVCSALKVCPMERTTGEPQQEARPPTLADAADSTRSTLSCSAQSSEFSSCAASASTEELELLTQLSRSSFDSGDSVHSSSSSSPSADGVPRLAWRPATPAGERGLEDNDVRRQVGQQEEAYVTMSSFYQIK